MAGLSIGRVTRLDVPGPVRAFRLRLRFPNAARCDVLFRVCPVRGALPDVPGTWPARDRWARAITEAVRAQCPGVLAGAPPQPFVPVRTIGAEHLPMPTLPPLPDLAD